jgi:hypothetical protein
MATKNIKISGFYGNSIFYILYVDWSIQYHVV